MGFLKGRIKPLQKQDPARFGAIPGVPLFARFKDRNALYIAGAHGKTEGGIHGRVGEGAFSVIVAGRYEDDEDHGDTIYYTGEGGHSRQSELQIKDQEWVRGNAALKRSIQTRKPVRVIRSHVLRSKYAPASGYRYDGLYRVTDAVQEVGKNGHAVCRFELKRIPGQAPLPGSPDVPAGSSRSTSVEEENPPAARAGPSLSKPAAARKRAPRKKASPEPEFKFKFKFEGSNSPPRPVHNEPSFFSTQASRRPIPGLY